VIATAFDTAWPAAALVLLAGVAVAGLRRRRAEGRKRAEAKARVLTADLDRLALVVRNTVDAVVITDAARRITFVNAAFERITGYAAAEALGRNPGQLLQCQGTDALTIERMRVALDAGQVFSGTVLNRAKDGRQYWIELAIQPIRDDGGRLTGFMSIESDVTLRREAEAALRASQTFLYNTGRIGGVGGWALDIQSGVVQWTDQTCRILDHEPGHQPTLQQWLACCPPEARPRMRQALDHRAESSSASDVELPFITAQGRPIWVRLAAECEFADGGAVRMVGALQDITARRAMEADIHRHAQLLRDAIATIDEAFVVFDRDDRIVFFNEKYREVYTRSRDLIELGARFEDIVRTGAERGQYAAANGRVDAWVSERVAQHRAGNTQLEQQLDDGRWMRIIERRTPDGHTVGFRVDITDLVRATEAAEQANRAQSGFIATVSHELRTPLQSIIGFSELGLHFAAGQAQFLPMFTDILAGGRRMLTLVNGLLDVSKMEGSGGALTPRRCDLSVLAAQVVHELRHMADERGLHVQGPDPAAALPVDVDGFRIQQVVRNVLANAIRFAPVGSSIRLEGRHGGGHGVWLSVRDQGPGIPPGELDTIFEPFMQSSRTRDGSGGTGLGLTICRKIMRAHGGRIEAANADGGGAVMTLWLPACAAAAAATLPAAPPAALRAPDLPIEA